MNISLRSLFILLTAAVITIQLYFLKDFWGYGFSITEDWTWLAHFAALKGNLLTKILEIGKSHSPYQGTMIVYVGFIDYFFPSNYLMIQVISFVGKIVATLLLFPLIFTLTKNRLLAFLGGLFFAISYPSYGSFITYTNSMEYWGISFLILFIIYYYKLISSKLKNDYRNFILTTLFLFLALQFTFIRLLGLIIVMMAVEFGLVLAKRASIKSAIIRTIVFLIIFFYFVSGGYDGGSASEGVGGIFKNISNYISEGNLFVLLHPLAGLSLTLVPSQYADLLTNFEPIEPIKSYLIHIILKFIPIMFLILTICSIILPVKTIRFYFNSVILNLSLLLLLYFFGSHYSGYARAYLVPQALFGSLILTISFALGIEWHLGKRLNILLFISFITPLLSFFFIFLNWLVNLGKNSLIVYGPIDKYLPVPQLGISIFLAALFTMVLARKYSSQREKLFLTTVNMSLLGLFFFFVVYSSYSQVQYFKIRKPEGVNLQLQKDIQVQLFNSYIKNKGDQIIYYVESSEASLADREQGLMLDAINSWPYVWWSYAGKKDSLGCIMPITRSWDLPVSVIKKNNEIFFQRQTRCPVKTNNELTKLEYSSQMMTMSLNNLFAFTLINGHIIDITDKVKKELQENSENLPSQD